MGTLIQTSTPIGVKSKKVGRCSKNYGNKWKKLNNKTNSSLINKYFKGCKK